MLAKKIFIDTLGIVLVICFFALTFSMFFGIQTPYLQTTTAELTNVKITYYDFAGYFRNIQGHFTNFGNELDINIPQRQWRSVAFLTLFEDLANNMAFIFNWFVFVINVLIWPVRLLCWLIKSAFIILGIIDMPMIINGQGYNPPWFMDVLTALTEQMQIPYIE